MNKRTSRYKGKRKAHYYSLAGALNSLSPTYGEDGIQQTGFGKSLGLNKSSVGLVGGLASATGGMANSAISGGLSSRAGNAITGVGSTIGGALREVNPILGGVVDLASNVIGGATNALFGSKMNSQKIAEVEASNQALANTIVDASSNASILNQFANQDWGVDFTKGDIGKDGVWSDKASKEYERLLKEKEAAFTRAQGAYNQAIASADANQDLGLLANYHALGGPFNRFDLGGPEGKVKRYARDSEGAQEFIDPAVKFLEDDFIWRKNRERNIALGARYRQGALSPNQEAITLDVINNTPIKLKRLPKGTLGGYTSGKKEIHVSKKKPSSETVVHELRHALDDRFSDFYPKEDDRYKVYESDYNHMRRPVKWLGAAYSSEIDPQELIAANTEMRYYISRDHNNATREELDDIIYNMSDKDLVNYIDKTSYIWDYVDDYYNDKYPSEPQLIDRNSKQTYYPQSMLDYYKELFKKNPEMDPSQFNIDDEVHFEMLEEDFGEDGVKVMKQYLNDLDKYNETIKKLESEGESKYNKEKLDSVRAVLRFVAQNDSPKGIDPYVNYAAKGGPLLSKGAEWSNGLTFINNGGSHEANPYEGVQVGVDQQGVPNLVEEGEVIWDDYVFSERLKVPKAFRDKYKLKGKDAISFAEAAEKFAEESKERPNDPISKRGRDTMLSLLMDQQEEVRMKKQQRQAKAQFNSLSPEEQLGIMQMAQQNAMPAGPEEGMNNMEGYPMYNQGVPLMAAYGGELGNVFEGEGPKSNRMTRKYDENYFKKQAAALGFELGDSFDFDPTNSTANLDAFNNIYKEVQRKNAYDTYVAGQRQKWINDEMASGRYKRGDNGQNVYAAKYYGDADVGRDYINAAGNRITADEYSKLKKADQDNYKYSQAVKGQFMRDYNNNIVYDYDNDVSGTYIPDDTALEKGFKWDDKDALKISYGPRELSGADNFLRYAPAIGSAIGFADSMFTKPDYTSSNILMDAAVREGAANPIGYNPIGNYMSYRPFDRNFYTNKLNAEAGAARRAILNSSSPSRNAALLAADFNAQSKLGDLARQAEEYNLAQRQKVEEFNRGTNMTNSDMALKTAMANMEENRNAKAAYTNNLTRAIALREQEDQQLAASRSANFNNFITNLGQLGEEAYTRNMIEALADRGTIRDMFKANGGPINRRKNKRRK